MVLTDRHFIAVHFDILFAIFGLVVQKLCQLKVHIHFLLINNFTEIGPKRYVPRVGLATVTYKRDPDHVSIHVGRGAHGQV